jgi:hypothetical protein
MNLNQKKKERQKPFLKNQKYILFISNKLLCQGIPIHSLFYATYTTNEKPRSEERGFLVIHRRFERRTP